jgi:hypothetical protein
MTLEYSSTRPLPKSFLALLLLLWARNPLWEYISGALSYVPGLGGLGETSIAIIIIFLAIVSWRELSKRIKLNDIFFCLGVIIIYFISYAFHPENQSYMDERYTRQFILTVVPYYLVGVLVNMDKCKKYFLYVSYLSILTQFIYIFVMDKGGVRGNDADNMIVYAYNILPHVTYVAYWMIEKRTFSSVLFFLLGFLLQISMANRGSIVCLISFILIYIVAVRFTKQKVSTKIAISVVGVLVIVFFEPVALALYALMSSLNLNTRVLDFVFSENFITSEGRDMITETIWGTFKNDMFETHGIGGENQLGIIYAHNIMLEWWFSFGIIMGSFVMIALICLLVKAFRKATSVALAFLLLLLTSGFECLFMSGTYLMTPLFFMLIGYSVNCIRNANLIGVD